MNSIIIIFGILSITLQALAEDQSPIVHLPNLGKIEGTYKTSFKGKVFKAFEGVPYARAPVGKYRFREPVLPKPWHGVWKANTIYRCMQYFQYTLPGEDFVKGDEDCLYLNIYTPTLDQNANLDVVVYIHGGAFMFLWGGFFGPDYIQDKNLVYININYRLGPLGFLSTEDDIVPGNNGLKDQILALKWINQNVEFFGGNPQSVTIFGMSAGGASIHFHFLCPKSQNLFHRGISQSGTLLNAWAMAEKPLEKTIKLSRDLGCVDTDSTKHLLKCLQRKPARQIVQSVKSFQPWLYNPFSPFGPVVDVWASDPVLPKHPYLLIKERKVAKVPWLVSYVSNEGLYPGADFYSDQYLAEIDENWNKLVPFILDYNSTVEPGVLNAVSQKIRQYYLSDKPVNKEHFLDFVKIISDRMFITDIERTVLQEKDLGFPIYFYVFEYRGAHSKSESRSGTNLNFGAAHGDDTGYIFKTNVNTTSTENDRKMIDLMTEIIASFAKTGKPSVPIEWPPVSANEDKLKYLRISTPASLSLETSRLESTKFWDSLPIEENEKLHYLVKDEL